MNRPAAGVVAMGFAAALAACASTPSGPYWQDPRWNLSLFNAIQGSLHYPGSGDDLKKEPVTGTIGFTYDRGRLEDVAIVDGTGSATLDTAMVQQVGAAKVPPAVGPDADTPRHYELELRMPTPLSDFFDAISTQAHENVRYPPKAAIDGLTGAVYVDFDYAGGSISNVQVSRSSGFASLDEAALLVVTHLQVSPPEGYLGTRMHLQLQMCYFLGKQGRDKCPPYKETLQLINIP